MSHLKGNVLFVWVFARIFDAILIFENPCVGQSVTLFTKSDLLVLQEEMVTLVCSVSDIPLNETLVVNITYENGTEIHSVPLINADAYKVQSIAITVVSNMTFSCAVSWGDFSAVAHLSISPLSNDRNYCLSDYSNGVIMGQTFFLTCLSSLYKTRHLKWSSSGNETLTSEFGLNRTSTLTNTIYVKSSEIQNGSVFTCELATPQNDKELCSVGPVYVYDELFVFINPANLTDPFVLSPGESKQYICSSVPISSLQWITPNGLSDSGIQFAVVASTVTVTVPSDSTFPGSFQLTCVGTLPNGTSVERVVVAIEFMTLMDAPERKVLSDTFIIVFVVVSCGLVVFVLLLIKIIFRLCKHSDSQVTSTSQSDDDMISDIYDYDYCDAESAKNTIDSQIDISKYANNRKPQGEYSEKRVLKNESIRYENAALIMKRERRKGGKTDSDNNHLENYENIPVYKQKAIRHK